MTIEDREHTLLHDRIDHESSRIDAVEQWQTEHDGQQEVKKSHTLEYIVIVLIVIETIFTAVACFHHG